MSRWRLPKSATTAEDTPVAIVLSASDKDANPLTYSIVSGPAKGTLSGTAPNLTYTPAADFSGTDSFTFKANDGTADSTTATVSIVVTAVNDVPVAVAKSATTAESTPVAIILTASDKDANPLTYSIVSSPAKGTLSGTAPNLTYTPAADFSGTDSFTFKANDGTVDSNTATVSIVVTASASQNHAPVFTANPISMTVTQGTPMTGSLQASDPDTGDSITFSKVSGPDWLQISATGVLSGTAPPATGASSQFTVRATDMAGDAADAILLIGITPDELPLPWDLKQVGESLQQAWASDQAGVFTANGTGRLSGTSDIGCFVWQTLSGDGEISARATTFEDADKLARCGLMIRDSLAPNSRHMFIGVNGDGTFHWVRRNLAGESAITTTSVTRTTPGSGLRLVRKGKNLTAYANLTGTGWTRIGTATANLGVNCYIGLWVSSGKVTGCTTNFSNITAKP